MHTGPQQRFRIDWVLVDELAIGPAPRAPRHLERLADAGIQAVFSLCAGGSAAANGSRPALCPSAPRAARSPQRPSASSERTADSPAAAAELAPTARCGVRALRRCDGAFTAGVPGLAGATAPPHPCQGARLPDAGAPGTNPLPGQLALLQELA